MGYFRQIFPKILSPASKGYRRPDLQSLSMPLSIPPQVGMYCTSPLIPSPNSTDIKQYLFHNFRIIHAPFGLFLFFFFQDSKSVTMIINYPGQSSARYCSKSKTELLSLITPTAMSISVFLMLLIRFPLAICGTFTSAQ